MRVRAGTAVLLTLALAACGASGATSSTPAATGSACATGIACGPGEGELPIPASEGVGDVPNNTVESNGAILVGEDGIPATAANPDVPTVTIYSDFLCPWCQKFEDLHGDSLFEMADAGEVNIEYVFMSKLATGPEGFSTRSAAAAYIVASEAPEAFHDFITMLFADQPTSEAEFLANDELAALAEGAGTPQGVVDRIAQLAADSPIIAYVERISEAAWEFGDTFPEALPEGLKVPFVLINGEPLTVNWTEEGQFEAALAAAQ